MISASVMPAGPHALSFGPFSVGTETEWAFDGARLDVALAQLVPRLSRRRLQEHVKAGCVRVADIEVTRPNTAVAAGAVIVLTYPSGHVATVTYVANGDKDAGKERVEVSSGGRLGILEDGPEGELDLRKPESDDRRHEVRGGLRSKTPAADAESIDRKHGVHLVHERWSVT